MTASTATGPGDDIRSRTQQSPLASQRAKEQSNHPSAANRTGRFTQYFPLGYKDGFAQWWANISPAAAEHAVLSYIPYLQKPPTHSKTGSIPPSESNSSMPITDDAAHTADPVTTDSGDDPYGPRRWKSNLVQLSGKNRALNEFSVERVGEQVDENLVMLHGYGAGLCFFYKNFEGLSRSKGWKLYALDLLGMGRSSRPPFRVHAKDQQGKLAEAESWFIDALEEWRVKKRIDKFTLLGHSLGGYMAVAYALKYPGHLNKLILASPVGIPEDPYAMNAAMPEPDDSTMQNEFTQDQEEAIKSHHNPNIPNAAKVGDNNNFLNARSKAEARNAADGNKNTPNAPRRPLPKWLTYLWDANISPFSIVRWGGPLGPRFVSGWTSRRFSHLPSEEAQALHNYSYSLFKQRGSGEYALAYILAPGAFARSPLIRRIQGVGRQTISPPSSAAPNASSNVSTRTNDSVSAGSGEKLSPAATTTTTTREHGIPVVMLYGENDWMDVAGGYAAEQKLIEEKERIAREGGEDAKRLEGGDSKVVVVQKAGHHVYLDGWEDFNEVIRKEMEDVMTTSRKRREMEQ
ncbi:MAG: hypothetical protein M1837_006874 [Sclerophora amabilis]|nr:MAG: hypothetical protein M1837_006874 [Sclerophora amabilis]